MRSMIRRTAGALVLAVLAGCGADPPPPTAAAPSAAAPAAPAPAPSTPPVGSGPLAQLPLGGRKIFPAYRVVAYYGTAGNATLGVLGEGGPEAMLPKLRKAAAGFAGGREVQVAYELIVTVAQAGPGPDGLYSKAIPDERIQRYVDHARRNRALVLLDLQPGRGDFLTQAKRLEKYLVQPHVGLALDPEWRMPPGKVPGKTIGTVGAAEVNSVSAYVAGLVAEHRLPEKLFVLHQFRASMITGVGQIRKRPGLALVQHVDGFGTRSEKDATWNRLRRPQQFHLGYKLFYDEDVKRYQARDLLRFRTPPELVSFQ